MELKAVKDFCKEFYKKFSVLDLRPFQLEFSDSPDTCSIVMVTHNEKMNIEAAITINENSVYLLKITCFNDLDTFFIFDSPLELYTNLLMLLLSCCRASRVFVSPSDAISVTLGRKIKNWRELVKFICSLTPKGQAKIVVQENDQYSLRLLETTFRVIDGELNIDGLYRSKIPYKDILELIHAVLEGLSDLLKIHDYEVNPFFEDEDPGRSP